MTTALWVVIAGLAALGSVLLVVAMRRVRGEIPPTVAAFARFRDQLEPARAELDGAVAQLRHRSDPGRRGRRTTSE